MFGAWSIWIRRAEGILFSRFPPLRFPTRSSSSGPTSRIFHPVIGTEHGTLIRPIITCHAGTYVGPNGSLPALLIPWRVANPGEWKRRPGIYKLKFLFCPYQLPQISERAPFENEISLPHWDPCSEKVESFFLCFFSRVFSLFPLARISFVSNLSD